MNELTIKKRNELIVHFGSVEKYQAGIFDKVPPIFLMICDEQGNITVDRESIGKYLLREMKEHSLTKEELFKRDIKTFEQLINDFYSEVFAHQKAQE